MGMACISLDDPALAVKELEFALSSGLEGIWCLIASAAISRRAILISIHSGRDWPRAGHRS